MRISLANYPYQVPHGDRLHLCRLDIYVRPAADLANRVGNRPLAAVLMTQLDDEKASLLEDAPAIASNVASLVLPGLGWNDRDPGRILWLANFPPSQVVKYRRLEKVRFNTIAECPAGHTVFADPFFCSVKGRVVCSIMDLSWGELGFPMLEARGSSSEKAF